MMTKHHPPSHHVAEFNCPLCGVYASQDWQKILEKDGSGWKASEKFDRVVCAHCKETTYWYDGEMIVPADIPVRPSHPDLPDECREDFEEARQVFAQSPRSAAALLRLCVQKLLVHLGGEGKNINADIKSLVATGLPQLVQKSLDYCRVVGNNAVHPGELDFNDTPDIAHSLFDLIDFIVEDRITRPKQVESLYERLPEGAREAIAARDGLPEETV